MLVEEKVNQKLAIRMSKTLVPRYQIDTPSSKQNSGLWVCKCDSELCSQSDIKCKLNISHAETSCGWFCPQGLNVKFLSRYMNTQREPGQRLWKYVCVYKRSGESFQHVQWCVSVGAHVLMSVCVRSCGLERGVSLNRCTPKHTHTRTQASR